MAFLFCRTGIERAAPVRPLVQKVSGGHFLARGRFHGSRNASKKDVGRDPSFSEKFSDKSLTESIPVPTFTGTGIFFWEWAGIHDFGELSNITMGIATAFGLAMTVL